MRSVFTEKDIKKLKEKYSSEIDNKAIAKGDETPVDSNLSAVSKFVPAEVISFFVAAFSFMEAFSADEIPKEIASWVVFIGGLIATILITFFTIKRAEVVITGLPKKVEIPGQTLKTILTTIAFIIWAFNIQTFTGNIELSVAWLKLLVGLLLIGYTVFAPRLYNLLP